MTREEEIRIAIDKLFPCGNNGRTYEQAIAASGFEAGVRWADRHIDTSVLWHDASEIPQENHKNIIYQTNYHSMYNVYIDFIPTCLRSCKILSRSWDEFVKEVNMRRWAYISDLLPKGGEG